MTETPVSQLKINVLSQEQYDRIKQAGTINENELYMTPASGGGSTSEYLPLTGGTLTGPVTFANNTMNWVGDDCSIGDQNVAGCLIVKGLNGTTGIQLQSYTSGGGSSTIKFNESTQSLDFIFA